MKILLALSLILNGILAYKVLEKRPVKVMEAPLERVIIQDHPAGVDPLPPKTPEEKIEDPGAPHIDSVQVEERMKSVEEEKKEFLYHELEMTPAEVKQIAKIRDNYSKKVSELIPSHNLTGEISIDKRRQILNLEEARQKEIVQVFGKKRWEKFQKYKEKYNRQHFKKSQAEGDFLIPMEI